jgi:hypothetical protein
VNSLDEMIARNEIVIDVNRLSFIKLDAEGSEPILLKGMRGLLSAAKPVLFMEVNYDSLAAAGSSPHELGQFSMTSNWTFTNPNTILSSQSALKSI